VHLSDRVVPVTVELQIRTVAMDFWASLEHTIYYKYRADVPPTLLRELARSRRDGRQSRRADGTAAHANPSGRSDRQRVAQLTLRSQWDESLGVTQGQ